MKLAISIVLVALLIGKNVMAEDRSPSQVTEDLRAMVLNLKPTDIGVSKENFNHPIFAVVMETGFAEGYFTLSAIADGSVSLYFSGGGGIIGGGEHKSVRTAAGYLLSGAQHFYERGTITKSFPKPESGKVTFFFVGFDGVRSYVAVEDDLGNEKDELSPLFFAAHNVISELRKIEETHNK